MKGLTEAAVSMGHEVTVFLSEESVSVVGSERGEEAYAGLMSRGARILVCRTSVAASGLQSRGGFLEGVEMSSLGELADLMGSSDRTVFLGGDGR